jgi:hypothetical protein
MSKLEVIMPGQERNPHEKTDANQGEAEDVDQTRLEHPCGNRHDHGVVEIVRTLCSLVITRNRHYAFFLPSCKSSVITPQQERHFFLP